MFKLTKNDTCDINTIVCPICTAEINYTYRPVYCPDCHEELPDVEEFEESMIYRIEYFIKGESLFRSTK